MCRYSTLALAASTFLLYTCGAAGCGGIDCCYAGGIGAWT